MQVSQINSEIKIPTLLAPVKPEEIPLTSQATNKIFADLGHKAPELTPAFAKNVSELKTNLIELEKVQKTARRDEILGWVGIALAIAAFVAVVILFCANLIDPAKNLVGFVCSMLSLMGTIPLVFTSGMLFSRVDDARKKDQDNKDAINKEFQKALPDLVNFYRSNSEQLSAAIEKNLTETRESLKAVQELPVTKTPAGENELAARVKLLETAKQEFIAARDYYVRYNDFVPAVAPQLR